jgi:predicted  nucleic acid-binding Zn-ribbon protein
MAYPDHRKDEHLRAIDADDDTVNTAEIPVSEQDISVADDEETVFENDYHAPYRDIWTVAALALAILLSGLWTGFYIWSQWTIISQNIAVNDIPAMIASWAIPIILMCAIYWMISRRRTAHAAYFERQTMLIDNAGRALEIRLQHMNGELAIAREFIANQSAQLEVLGRKAVSDINQHAQNIHSLLGDSQSSMETVAKVSAIAEKNMSRLREQMPVVIGTSKNMVNQIGSAEIAAQRQIKGMVSGFQKINEFGQASDQQIIDLEKRVSLAVENLQAKLSEIESLSDRTGEVLIENSDKAAAALSTTHHNARNELSAFVDGLNGQLLASQKLLTDQIAQFETLTTQIGENQEGQYARLNEIIASLEGRIGEIQTNLNIQEEVAGDKTAQISFALSALRSELEHIAGSLASSDAMASQLQQQGNILQSDFANLANNIEEKAFFKVEAIAAAIEKTDKTTSSAADKIDTMRSALDDIDRMTRDNIITLSDQEQHIARYSDSFGDFTRRNTEQCTQAMEALAALEANIDALERASDTKILAKFGEIGNSSDALLTKVQTDLDGIVGKLTEDMAQRSSEALQASIRDKSDEVIGKLQMAVNNALGATHQASATLTSQLDKVDKLANNLEERISHMRETSPLRNDQELSRNLALLTESLNSTSIDVAKILSNDVTDTAWASYLKGDRGVFTRRAVRLLNNSDVREIAEHYERDAEFNETVNRYIHDFEAILRDLLSTRNGEAISVTLLSSDMGKLYVALAQAIERFR